MIKCTGCGQCCLSEKCQAAVIAVGDSDEICPFLKLIRPDFYRCLLVDLEQFFGVKPVIKKALAIDKGCTKPHNSNQVVIKKGGKDAKKA